MWMWMWMWTTAKTIQLPKHQDREIVRDRWRREEEQERRRYQDYCSRRRRYLNKQSGPVTPHKKSIEDVSREISKVRDKSRVREVTTRRKQQFHAKPCRFSSTKTFFTTMHQLSITKFLDMCPGCRVRTKELNRLERQASKMPAPLASFPQFPQLPTEIRMMIWSLSLQARTVEIQWTQNRGFFTRVPTPVALRVCHDSRDAVKSKYPVCFGNVIYKPSIVFNFALDTIYIDHDLQHQALHFLASLSTEEVAKVKYLAIDHLLNEDFEIGGEIEWNLIVAYRTLASKMPALQEYWIVCNLAYCTEDGIREGDGPMEIYEDWPVEVWNQHYCSPDMWIHGEGEEWTCGQDELPGYTTETAGLKIPKMGGIWGWRPIKK